MVAVVEMGTSSEPCPSVSRHAVSWFITTSMQCMMYYACFIVIIYILIDRWIDNNLV